MNTKMEPVCVQDIERLAYDKMEKLYSIYIKSGAAMEDTLKENCRAFQRIKMRPRILQGVSEADLSTTILGQPISMPICISPTAYHKLAHPEGELATVRAAAAHQTCMTLSYMANTSVRDVSKAAPSCLKWCALKFAENENFVRGLVHQAENEGFKAIVLTCDSTVPGQRFSVRRSKFIVPSHIAIPNMKLVGASRASSFFGTLSNIFGKRGMSWEDVRWLKSFTRLPIVLKGILTAEDAKMAVQHGVDGIWVSNHGGRQLDGVSATGEEGAKKVLQFLREELRTAMILSGCGKLEDITRHHVIKSPASRL